MGFIAGDDWDTVVLRRLAFLGLVLLGVSLVVFFLLRGMPGVDPLAAYIAPGLPISADALSALRKELHLDEPFPVQYALLCRRSSPRRLGLLAHRGPAGPGRAARAPPGHRRAGGRRGRAQRRPRGARRHRGRAAEGPRGGRRGAGALDHRDLVPGVLAGHHPAAGLLLLSRARSACRAFPRAGGWATWSRSSILSARSPASTSSTAWSRGNLPFLVSALSHLVLPSFTLSLISLAAVVRIMRASMLEVLRQDYILLARSKGLPAAGRGPAARAAERDHAGADHRGDDAGHPAGRGGGGRDRLLVARHRPARRAGHPEQRQRAGGRLHPVRRDHDGAGEPGRWTSSTRWSIPG